MSEEIFWCPICEKGHVPYPCAAELGARLTAAEARAVAAERKLAELTVRAVCECVDLHPDLVDTNEQSEALALLHTAAAKVKI